MERPYLTHEERLEKLYGENTNSATDTHVIQTFERDIRLVLDRIQNAYSDDDMRNAIRRLRTWVGYQA